MQPSKPWIGFRFFGLFLFACYAPWSLAIEVVPHIELPGSADKLFRYRATAPTQCGGIDLRGQHNIPIRDQKDISWCFAHAGSDFLQYNHNIPFQVSAADVAIGYNELRFGRTLHWFQRIFLPEEDTKPSQTGFMLFALRNTIEEGACPEENLPSDQWLKVDATGAESRVNIRKAILEMYDLQAQIKMGLYRSAAELPYRYRFKKLSDQRLFNILKSSKQKFLLSHLRGEACARDRFPISKNFSYKMAIKNSKIFNNVHRALEQSRPAGLDFFSSVLKDVDNAKRKMSSLHTVLIYGRKFDARANECSYLIKNSYGTDCSVIDTRLDCEQGYVWMPESLVYRSMTSTVTSTVTSIAARAPRSVMQ